MAYGPCNILLSGKSRKASRTVCRRQTYVRILIEYCSASVISPFAVHLLARCRGSELQRSIRDCVAVYCRADSYRGDCKSRRDVAASWNSPDGMKPNARPALLSSLSQTVWMPWRQARLSACDAAAVYQDVLQSPNDNSLCCACCITTPLRQHSPGEDNGMQSETI